MLKQRYIILISCLTFIFFSSNYGIDYFDRYTFEEEKSDLITQYQDDYQTINNVINQKLQQKLNITERGTYLLLQTYFALEEANYDLINETMNYVETYLMSNHMFEELTYFYNYIANMYYEQQDYYGAYLTLDKNETLHTVLLNKDKSTENLIGLLTASNDKLKLSYLTGLFIPNAYFSKLQINLDTYYPLNESNFIYFKYLYNYYYHAQDAMQAIQFGTPIAKSRLVNELCLEDYYTTLIRLGLSYTSINNYEIANQFYQFVKLAPVSFTPLQIVELLQLESHLLILSHQFESGEQKLLTALAYTKDTNSIFATYSIIEDLISFYDHTNNMTQFNYFTDELRALEKSIISTEDYVKLSRQIESERYKILTEHTSFLLDEQVRANQFSITIIMTGLVALGAYSYLVYTKHNQTKELNKKILIFNEHQRDQLKYYQTLTTYQEQMRELQHDLRNHHTILHSLLYQQKYTSMDRYLTELGSKVQEISYTRLAQHQILDTLLLSKQQTCKQKGILLTTTVDFPKETHISDLTIITLFSNIFDNAIEACEQINNPGLIKKIVLTVKTQGNLTSITMENTKQHKLIEKNNTLKTTKEDKQNHGIGLTSVKNSIAPYGGTLKYTHTNTTFTISILLRNLPRTEE